MRERAIQNQILRAFATREGLRLWRANTGAALLPGRRGQLQRVQFGVVGQADLSGIIPVVATGLCPCCGAPVSTPPQGVRLEIECKAPGGRQSPEQRHYEAMIRRHGGIYIVASSAQDVAAILNPLLDQEAGHAPAHRRHP